MSEEKFNLPVYPVLINILSLGAPADIPCVYQSDFLGIRVYQDYRVINLWEVEAETVFEQNLVSLLPFVPILKGGEEVTLVLRLINKQLGSVNEEIKAKIRHLTTQQLEELAEALLDFTSVEELEAWLSNSM